MAGDGEADGRTDWWRTRCERTPRAAVFTGHGVPVCLPCTGATSETGGSQGQHGPHACVTGQGAMACRRQ
jgi:hypothetical protein